MYLLKQISLPMTEVILVLPCVKLHTLVFPQGNQGIWGAERFILSLFYYLVVVLVKFCPCVSCYLSSQSELSWTIRQQCMWQCASCLHGAVINPNIVNLWLGSYPSIHSNWHFFPPSFFFLLQRKRECVKAGFYAELVFWVLQFVQYL